MGSENNMVAVLSRIVVAHNRLRRSEITPQEFDEYGLSQLARLAQPDAQQGAPSPASGEGVKGDSWCHCSHDAADGLHYVCDDHRAVGNESFATPLAAATQPAVTRAALKRMRQVVGRKLGFTRNDPDDRVLVRRGDLRQLLAALTGAGENGEQGA